MFIGVGTGVFVGVLGGGGSVGGGCGVLVGSGVGGIGVGVLVGQTAAQPGIAALQSWQVCPGSYPCPLIATSQAARQLVPAQGQKGEAPCAATQGPFHDSAEAGTEARAPQSGVEVWVGVAVGVRVFVPVGVMVGVGVEVAVGQG